MFHLLKSIIITVLVPIHFLAFLCYTHEQTVELDFICGAPNITCFARASQHSLYGSTWTWITCSCIFHASGKVKKKIQILFKSNDKIINKKKLIKKYSYWISLCTYNICIKYLKRQLKSFFYNRVMNSKHFFYRENVLKEKITKAYFFLVLPTFWTFFNMT